MSDPHAGYYLPEPSRWPLIITAGLALLLFGVALTVNDVGFGTFLMGFGAAIVIYVLFGWFGEVIRESEGGQFNDQVDRSFRWGMAWFIFSEVMFFSAFFGALFYSRVFAVPWLSGAGHNYETGHLLWPGFEALWPLLQLPNPTAVLPDNQSLAPPHHAMGAWGIPAVNTLILLSSGVTVTFAHWALKKDNRRQLIFWLGATVLLGALFLFLQAHEYIHAYTELNLRLNSGIYGTTFFMLTGFHGMHVTLGAIMLTVVWFRCLKGHFTPNHHFAFEGVAWYWHFVDVVWLCLFVFVYWL